MAVSGALRFILTLDPGFHTGWSYWCDGDLMEQGVVEGGLDGFIAWLDERWSRTMYPIHALVIEDFIAEPNFTGRVWASEVKGAAIARIAHNRLVVQKRTDKTTLFRENGKVVSETKRFERLREWGFSGVSHELDAITHALVFYKREKHPYVLRKYWPSIYN